MCPWRNWSGCRPVRDRIGDGHGQDRVRRQELGLSQALEVPLSDLVRS